MADGKAHIDRVELRPLEYEDAKPLARLMNNEKVWNFLRDFIPFPYSENDGKEFIQLCKAEVPVRTFAILYDGQFAGTVGLSKQKDIYRKTAELGYWLGEPFWGNGIGTEAVKRAVDHWFREMDLLRIFAGVFENNPASARILEKNGFQYEGKARKAVIKNGKVLDELRFAMVREESES